jgi:hypothetical protein
MAEMRNKSQDQWPYSVLCVHNLGSTYWTIGESMRIGMSTAISNSEVLTYCSSKILFMQGFMMDGNFKAEHMKMRNPENDVPFSEGTGFMVSRGAYELHLQSALERQQVRYISNISVRDAHCGKEVNMS